MNYQQKIYRNGELYTSYLERRIIRNRELLSVRKTIVQYIQIVAEKQYKLCAYCHLKLVEIYGNI